MPSQPRRARHSHNEDKRHAQIVRQASTTLKSSTARILAQDNLTCACAFFCCSFKTTSFALLPASLSSRLVSVVLPTCNETDSKAKSQLRCNYAYARSPQSNETMNFYRERGERKTYLAIRRRATATRMSTNMLQRQLQKTKSGES